MAALAERLQSDLNAARKGGDKARTLLLGTIIADVRNREIEHARKFDYAQCVAVHGAALASR